MTDPQDLPDLVRAAQETAKAAQARMTEQCGLIATETKAIELAAIDIFAVFEARMQRHFKRGPLSRKVKAALLDAGQADLADRLHQHYLAINVLKHGTGASHRELLGNKSNLITVKDSAPDGESLIDVTPPQFFDGLAETILAAYAFLENR